MQNRLFYKAIFLLALCGVSLGVAAQEVRVLTSPASGRAYGLEVTQPLSTDGSLMLAPVESEVTPEILKANADSFIATYKDLIGLTDPATQIAPVQQVDGAVRYEQKHLGLPIVGAEVVVHLNPAGNVTSANMSVAKNLPTSIKPALSQVKVKEIAIAAAQKEIGTSVKLSANPAQLMILPLDIINDQATPDSRLVWKVRVQDVKQKGEFYSNEFYIDANKGTVELSITNHEGLTREVYDCARYTGQPPGCVLDVQNSVYPPFTYMNGRSETKPIRGPNPAYDWPYFYLSTDVDTLFTLMGSVHSFVQSSFSINGANNQGGLSYGASVGKTRGAANTDPGVTYCPNNAAFNSAAGTINFCRGMVVPDVVGHEYGHGIAFWSRSSNNVPSGYTYSGHTASLVESFADIIGESFESSYSGSNDWLRSPASYGGIYRNLSDPHAVVSSTTGLPFPDRTYDQGFYCGTDDAGGAHVNSTVVSHAFYLLAQGGEHNGCEITAQGIEEAKQIFYKAWRGLYIPQSAPTAFSNDIAYIALRDACNARFVSSGGYTHPTCVALTKALQAVELDQDGKCTATPEAAPACAQKNAGTVFSSRPSYLPTTIYAPGETVWARSYNGIAGKQVNVHIAPQVANRANWSAISSIQQSPATVESWGVINADMGLAPNPGMYDLIVDGNRDGFYQPWADSITTFQVKIPVNGDGTCYQGETRLTSENCMQSVDCGCSSRQQCEDILCPGETSLEGPAYYCVPRPLWPNRIRPRYCLAE